MKSKCAGYGLGVAVLLASAGASAATLARQRGAFGVVTYDVPIVIESVADWDALSAAVAGGLDTEGAVVLLANDVGPVTTTVGTAEHPFAGVFDGGSNTLTLALSGADSFLAPFSTIAGATIRDLKVAGTVAGNMHCSGLVGRIVGGAANLIENCKVAAAISSSGSHFGGFVGHSVTNVATLRGCVFSGSLFDGTYVATFHGWSDDGAATTLIDCLDASASDEPIGRGTDAVCVSNTYYLESKDFDNEERLWSEGMRGKRAYTVAEGEGVAIDFGAPSATYAVAGLAAYPTGLAYNGTFYAGEGDTVRLDLAATSPSGMVVDDYVASAGTLSQSGSTWTLAMPDGPVVVSSNWTPIDLSALTSNFTAEDGDVLTGTTPYIVAVPAGALVTINGVAVTGVGGATVPAPAFAAGGEAVTTKFERGAGDTWAITAFAELANDAVGADVPDDAITVYRGDTLDGITNAVVPTITGKKSAVKVEMTVDAPTDAPQQFFRVGFGD